MHASSPLSRRARWSGAEPITNVLMAKTLARSDRASAAELNLSPSQVVITAGSNQLLSFGIPSCESIWQRMEALARAIRREI